MAAPALVYLAINLAHAGGSALAWPIPTATDIAFALAALALVGRGLPESLRLFLLTLAIADDLGAIGLIAVLYSGHVHAWPLIGAAVTLLALIGLSEWKDAPFLFRAAGFVVLATFALKSGVSTSLAGVAAAFTVPIGPRRPGQEGVLRHFMQSLHPYVAFAILPLFAFTAAGFSLAGLRWSDVFAPIPLGVAAGLFLGKQVGVLAAVFGLVRTGLARRPTGATWFELYGVALLCGVGFTLSLFIGALAFAGKGELVRSQMTLGVATGSIVSALTGMTVLAIAQRLRARASQE
jgi:NhaA family Na+:H+ antiporter